MILMISAMIAINRKMCIKVPRLKAKNPTTHVANNTTVIKLITSPTSELRFNLKYISALNYSKNYCNQSDNKKNVNDSAGAVCKKSNCPGDDQDYCDDVK